jgi:hypothetical protein
LCCDILAGDGPADAPDAHRGSHLGVATEKDDLGDFLRGISRRELEETFQAILSHQSRLIDGNEPTRVIDYQCSFCDAKRGDARLITTSRIYICEVCVENATMLMSQVGHK